MKSKGIFVILAAALFFSQTVDIVQAEEIFGVKFSDKEVTFHVLSTGCTNESYFKLILPDLDSKSPSIGIERIKEDVCKARPMIKEVKFALADFGISKKMSFLKIVNTFSTGLN